MRGFIFISLKTNQLLLFLLILRLVGRGSIAIRYDLTGEPRTNAVTFSDFVNEGGEGPRDSEYGYLQRTDGSGRFDFLTLADVDNDAASQLENLHIVSNWDATGAGRSDVAACSAVMHAPSSATRAAAAAGRRASRRRMQAQ